MSMNNYEVVDEDGNPIDEDGNPVAESMKKPVESYNLTNKNLQKSVNNTLNNIANNVESYPEKIELSSTIKIFQKSYHNPI